MVEIPQQYHRHSVIHHVFLNLKHRASDLMSHLWRDLLFGEKMHVEAREARFSTHQLAHLLVYSGDQFI